MPPALQRKLSRCLAADPARPAAVLASLLVLVLASLLVLVLVLVLVPCRDCAARCSCQCRWCHHVTRTHLRAQAWLDEQPGGAAFLGAGLRRETRVLVQRVADAAKDLAEGSRARATLAHCDEDDWKVSERGSAAVAAPAKFVRTRVRAGVAEAVFCAGVRGTRTTSCSRLTCATGRAVRGQAGKTTPLHTHTATTTTTTATSV